MKRIVCFIVGIMLVQYAQKTIADTTAADLIELDIEELVHLDVEIESAGKNVTRALDLAYAGNVITAKEIRSSGARTIPDALRLIPGVNVGQISAGEWAVGIRGAAGRFSRFVLVMVDGRIAYNSVFSGVNWDELNIAVEQIARIEVIRGPNASTWGANAVNGIIHIITQKPALQSNEVAALAGTEGYAEALLKGSAQLSRTWHMGGGIVAREWDGLQEKGGGEHEAGHQDWRINLLFGQESERSESFITADLFAVEQAPEWSWLDADTFQSESAANREDKIGWTLQGAHKQKISAETYWNVRASADQTLRETTLYDWDSQNYQLDLEAGAELGKHQIIAGINTRLNRSDVVMESFFDVHFTPNKRDVATWGVFLSDEIRISNSLSTTLALRLDDSELSGSNLQPSFRAIWSPTASDRLWAAFSEGAATPSRALTDLHDVPYQFIPGDGNTQPPVFLVLDGYANEQKDTRLQAIEMGYRKTIGKFSIDFSLFNYDYKNDIGVELDGPPQPIWGDDLTLLYLRQELNFANINDYSTRGGEVLIRAYLADFWNSSFNISHVENADDAALAHTTAVLTNTLEINSSVSLYVALRYSDGTLATAARYDNQRQLYSDVDDYIVLDANLDWSLNKHWQLGLNLSNVGKAHTEVRREEFFSTLMLVEPRTAIKLSYQF